MKLTKIVCPNCNGTLDIPEGMKEGFVSCKFCNTKIYLEPYKPDITQNIHIDKVNYNTPYTAPPKKESPKYLLGILLAVLFLPSIIIFLSLSRLFYKSSDSSTSIAASPSYCTTPEDSTIISFVEQAFNKPVSELTPEDYASIQYLDIQKKSGKSDNTAEQWVFSYADSVDEAGNALEKKTISLPSTDSIDESSLQAFTGLVSLNLGENISFSYDNTNYKQDLKNLNNLKYYAEHAIYAGDLSRILPHPEEILGLSGVNFSNVLSLYFSQDNSEINIEKIMSEFTSLESLDVRVDEDYEGGLLFLRNLPGLKRLTLYIIGNDAVVLDLSPLSSLSNCTDLSITGPYQEPLDNVSVLSGMPQLENLKLKNITSLKDLNFVKNMPKLKSLSLDTLPILSLDGLANHLSLNSLYLDCHDVENVNALSTLSSLQKLYIDYHNYDIPDLHGLTALEEANLLVWDLDKIAHMPSLKKLTIRNYMSDYSADILRGMNSLSDLCFVGRGITGLVDTDLGNVLRELPALERLTMLGTPMDRYKDYTKSLSNIGVREMYFYPEDDSNVADGPVLSLSLSRMEDDNSTEILALEKAEIHNVDDDSKNFDQNAKAYLSHFKAVKKLIIPGNKLQSLDCLEGLNTIEELDISDNYISDISMLRNLPNLKKVKLAGNSIANMEILPDTVEVVNSFD